MAIAKHNKHQVLFSGTIEKQFKTVRCGRHIDEQPNGMDDLTDLLPAAPTDNLQPNRYRGPRSNLNRKSDGLDARTIGVNPHDVNRAVGDILECHFHACIVGIMQVNFDARYQWNQDVPCVSLHQLAYGSSQEPNARHYADARE